MIWFTRKTRLYRRLLWGLAALLLVFVAYLNFFDRWQSAAFADLEDVRIDRIPRDRFERIEIVEDSTFGSLMKEANIDYAEAMDVYNAAQDFYDLVKIRLGRFLVLRFDHATDEFKELTYKIDSEDELRVYRAIEAAAATTSAWTAEIQPIDYETKQKTVEGRIETSLYQAALDSGIDERAIIELANAFQWTIDFAMDPRVGDTFKFIFEERYLDGEYIMPGRILAAKYVNEDTEHRIYYFEESEKNKGYFDADGNSVQKMFLRAPVAYKYISSGFTTGARYIARFQTFTSSHMAIDYAAAIGTPVRAVGDGTVAFAGWKGSYGRYITVRHNGTYSTNYAHLNGYAVSSGQKVKQGDVVGYVGSSGFSTGPHLHYEMVKNGSKVNPLQEVLPPGEPIAGENMERFLEVKDKWDEVLK